MPKGVLWVSSRITRPSTLTPTKFCDWYENRHIQEVLSLSGIPSARRYEALEPQPAPTTWSSEAPWLTVYEMPDTSYRNTDEFKGLDGQSRPSQEIFEGIFQNARFDTRFYEEVQVYENPGSDPRSGTFLISAALEPPPGAAEEDFDRWYREEHVAELARSPTFVRTRRYRVIDGTTLNEFERTRPVIPKFLALHEFSGEGLPWGDLARSAETAWAKRVMGGLAREEIGWYTLKRDYLEKEWGSVGV